MKKVFAGLALATSFIIISCSKEKKGELAVDTQKVQEVIDFKGDPGQMVVAFNILNPAEKAYAFKKHISDNYKNLDLNESQIEFVKSAIKMIVPEMYMEYKKDSYAGTVAILEHRAIELFSETDYIYLFQNIKAFGITSDNPPAPGDCFCNWNSTCTPYADTAGPDCIEGLNSCTQTNSGCGFLWLSPCKGKCGRIPA